MADADNERTTTITYAKPPDATRVVIRSVVVTLDVGGRPFDIAIEPDGGGALLGNGSRGSITARKSLDVIKTLRDALVAAGALP